MLQVTVSVFFLTSLLVPRSTHAHASIRRAFSFMRIPRTSMVGLPKGHAPSRVSVLSTTQNDQLINLQAIPVAISPVHSSFSTLYLCWATCSDARPDRGLIYTLGPRGCSVGTIEVRASNRENAVRSVRLYRFCCIWTGCYRHGNFSFFTL